jgi:putative colanic acid biosynthesis UDP-glucose lipid carrier transferase
MPGGIKWETHEGDSTKFRAAPVERLMTPILRSYRGAFATVLRVLDAALIALALMIATTLLEREWRELNNLALLVAIPLFLIAGGIRNHYASWRLASMDDEFRSILLTWFATSCALIVGLFLTKSSSSYSRLELLVWFLITPAMLIGMRLGGRAGLRALRSSGRNLRTAAVAGATGAGSSIAEMLGEQSNFGVRVVGVFDGPNASPEGNSTPIRLAGDFDDLVLKVRNREIDYVFIALPMREEARIVQLANRLADTTASVYVVPDLFVFDLMRARWATINGLPAVSVYESPFDGLSGIVKRAEDLLLGSILLACAVLPMIAIAIGLKVTKAPSIFFRQQRYGLNGKVVRVWKFRTMTVSEDGNDVVTVKGRNADSRVTPFGAFLRATSLDELPQLFNVLSGEMSLVGPRPHAIKVNEEYRRLIHGYMLRHKVKPGITGWAQVNGWHGDDTLEKMQKRVEHDLHYLRNWSLWLDLRILVRTAMSVLSRGKGTA